MKVLLLSDTYSEHTEKWALGLADRGIEVGLFSFNKADYAWYDHPGVTVCFEPEQRINAESFLTKLSYLKYVKLLKRVIHDFQPDILHAHYATSYGLIGVLAGFHPLIISVWGSDVYNFPSRSAFHRKIFKFNLEKADLLLSTSHVMKHEIEKYTRRDVLVTPFGVDVSTFTDEWHDKRDAGVVRVGTIKPIKEKYGIIDIIDAAQILVRESSQIRYEFYLIGSGDIEKYEAIIAERGLKPYFTVTGRVPFNEVSNYHKMLDIFLNVSIDNSESFGVATVEAMACGKPVIVSDVGGLMEVVNNGEFGIVIRKHHPDDLANAIRSLAMDPAKASALGKKARQHVLDTYNWERNLDSMITHYNELLETVG